jgi:hypothetical protein
VRKNEVGLGVSDVVFVAAGVAVGGDGELGTGADLVGGASVVHAEIGATASMTAAARMTGRDLAKSGLRKPAPELGAVVGPGICS